LESYARRGVFRSFSQTSKGPGRAEFSFHWLWNLRFRLTFDEKRGALSFNKLLPDIPAGSQLETDLKAFISDCCSPDRPEHRRCDTNRVSIRCSNRRGTFGVTFRISGNDYEYGAKQAINVVNEMFLGFLSVRHHEYIVKHFHLSSE